MHSPRLVGPRMLVRVEVGAQEAPSPDPFSACLVRGAGGLFQERWHISHTWPEPSPTGPSKVWIRTGEKAESPAPHPGSPAFKCLGPTSQL